MPQATKPRKVRCTCSRCNVKKMLPAASIDRSEPFLCEKCDDLFILFQNSEGRTDTSLKAFLARYK